MSRRKVWPKHRLRVGRDKTFAIKGVVRRTDSQYRKWAFEACVRIGKGRYDRAGACSVGRNPRKAMARAMVKLSKTLNSRKGAFGRTRRRR